MIATRIYTTGTLVSSTCSINLYSLLTQIDGVNGTLVANQFVRPDATQPGDTKRTLITLDNGGNWELVIAPDRYKNGTEVNCNPPQCSLHFHMSTSDYARLGVYSQVCVCLC